MGTQSRFFPAESVRLELNACSQSHPFPLDKAIAKADLILNEICAVMATWGMAVGVCDAVVCATGDTEGSS